MTTTTTASPDFAAITKRQRDTWATGDFNVIAMAIMPVAYDLVAAADPRPGWRVLDVACGSGNCALVAATRHCDVTGIDYVPALLERARQRAAAEGTRVEFREADAQNLPFPDHSFDVVLSSFGVMFAPDQARAAGELLRVCRPGGRIALANWKPEGFGGDFFRTVARYAPPPPGLQPGTRWGTQAGVDELLGAGTSSVRVEPKSTTAYFRSMDHAVETFRTWFGPVRRAFEAQDAAGQKALLADVAAVFGKYNRSGDGTVAMEWAYSQVVAVVK